MAYKSNYTGPQIDEAIRQVLTGEVVENNTTNEIGEGIKKPISSEAVFKELSNKGYTYEGVKIAGEGPHEVQGYTIFNGQYSQDKYVVVSNKSYKLEIDKTINVQGDGPSFSITYNKDASGKGIITIEKQNSGDSDQTVFVVNTITTLPDVLIPGSIARKEDLNLYVADFTIEDLDGLSETIPLLYTNARALIGALAAGKAIGIRQGNNESMSIASAYYDSRTILLTVISSSGTMYKVYIDSALAIDPEVEDIETGKIHWGFIQVTPIETTFAPFNMDEVVGVVDKGYQIRVTKNSMMAILETNEPLFIQDGSSGVVPASYSITKQDGNPTAIDIDIVYNGLYHIHWDITDDPMLYLTQDTVSYTPFSDAYIVSEFTVEDIVDQSTATSQKLTISRAFLDAAYKGALIKVRRVRNDNSHVSITVDRINNPNESTAIRFKVQFENVEYEVECTYDEVLTGGMPVDAIITSYNLVDWNENNISTPGYIANRTHHLGSRESFVIGSRFSLKVIKGTHYIDNYKLLYDGKLYALPTEPGVKVFISNYFTIVFNSYSESGNTSTYTFTSNPLSSLSSPTFEICRGLEEGGYKTLDEFYLPDGAKPWKTTRATVNTVSGSYIFKGIDSADIANRDNVIRNKVIYDAYGKGSISITPLSTTSILEFKIIAGGAQDINISNKPLWENGGKPETSATHEVIYSFLILEGKVYVSAKVYSI